MQNNKLYLFILLHIALHNMFKFADSRYIVLHLGPITSAHYVAFFKLLSSTLLITVSVTYLSTNKQVFVQLRHSGVVWGFDC